MLKFKENSSLDNIIVGVVSGIILAFIITTIIIKANSANISVWEHYSNFSNNILIKTSVLMSLKGGAIAIMPLFYLFLNKKMMKAVRGLVFVMLLIGIIIVWGSFF